MTNIRQVIMVGLLRIFAIGRGSFRQVSVTDANTRAIENLTKTLGA
jgi:hypothetical protein